MTDKVKTPISMRTYGLAALGLAGLAYLVGRRGRPDSDGPPSARDIHVTPEPLPSYGH
ncbi:hypothetical protein [Novosphingobium sp. SG707]|uniref:hypothetical protein n=1 Tax=Novosphingobium sp. SG707 TaxID=2586996 RepID=UPI000B203E8D|nr:hypothetical protein [Novosphingobium sp. SG707]